MFNLLKKEDRKYPKIVTQIHNEFLNAGDKILQEAKAILDECNKKSVDKGKRLAALGFNKTPEAVIAIETVQKFVTTKELADLVQYYRINYPNNKFITDTSVKEICQKYGLVFGDISMYKGFVPENKLEIIEKFKINKKDIPYLWVTDQNGNIIGSVSKDECPEGLCSYIDSSSSAYVYLTGSNGKRIDYHFKCPQYEKFNHLEFVKLQKLNVIMRICAPLKDMEVPSGKQVVGHKIQDIPDPVVLQPVKGGYLIVCAWGDEASDEIVINEVHN